MAALMGEINFIREQDRPLLWLRVTEDAIEGSPIAVPATPERIAQASTVTGEELGYDGMEILVHPTDYLEAEGSVMACVTEGLATASREFMGYPVMVQ